MLRKVGKTKTIAEREHVQGLDKNDLDVDRELQHTLRANGAQRAETARTLPPPTG